jgi:small conductance mechanosensitive channel
MLEKPEVWGAQELSSREVTMRIVAKTTPMRQWEVARELRARVKAALDAAGVVPVGPDTVVITSPSGSTSRVGAIPPPGEAAAERAVAAEDPVPDVADPGETAGPAGTPP